MKNTLIIILTFFAFALSSQAQRTKEIRINTDSVSINAGDTTYYLSTYNIVARKHSGGYTPDQIRELMRGIGNSVTSHQRAINALKNEWNLVKVDTPDGDEQEAIKEDLKSRYEPIEESLNYWLMELYEYGKVLNP